MADNRTMAQMLQAPIEGYEDAIVVPPINANNFELKQPLINLVQSNKFTGRQDPHNHLRFFNKVTSTFRHPEVPNTSIKLLLFPFSLDGEARDWLDKEPPRSILTWDDLQVKVRYSRRRANDSDVSTDAPPILRMTLSTTTSLRSFLRRASFLCLLFVNSYDAVEETSTDSVPPPLTQKVQETNSQTTKVNQEGIVNGPKTYELKLPYSERRNVEKGMKKTSPTIQTDDSFPSSSPMKSSDSTSKEFTDEFTPPNSLPPGDDVSILKKDFQEETFRIISNPLFEFDDNFKSSNVNPLFEENDKDVKIKSSSSSTLTSPEASKLEAYLEKDSIPPRIDLTFPPIFKISSSNPTSPTLTGEKIRKQIICLLATHLHKKPKPRPQEVKEIKENEEEVSRDVPIHAIVMPIRITFDNPIDFNDHLSKPKDLKKDLPISFDSTTESSILPHPLLDSDSPFTAELSASVTLNSLGNEDKVFKPGLEANNCVLNVRIYQKSQENSQARTRESEEFKAEARKAKL
ncbi:hypothetical protein Tco_1109732 [Tanacetum coccineum]|uniref:Reverse transcriptase domain-containing protein n=1 Tax=Tanacetum coccineum TaxID=301880 RepID=A0ABQ5IGW5_9ASTR